MIATPLTGADRQVPPLPDLENALEFLRRPGAAALPDGEYELDGRRVYAIVQRYATAAAPEPRFEAHRRYIDVQYVAQGEEVIGWTPLAGLAAAGPYDPAKDISFGRAAGAWTPVRLGAGELAVLWPEDAHAPRLAAGAPGPVVKIVVKVEVPA